MARKLFIQDDEILVVCAPKESEQTIAFAGPMTVEEALKTVRGYDTYDARKFLRVNAYPGRGAQFERPEDVTEDIAKAWDAQRYDLEDWVEDVLGRPVVLHEDADYRADMWRKRVKEAV